MQPLKNITTLEELRRTRKELSLKHRITKREIVHNFGTTTTNVKDLLLKRIALPVGGVAAAAYGISKLPGSRSEHDTAYVNGQQVQLQRADDGNSTVVMTALLGIGRLLYNRYKQNRMVDRISHRTAKAVLEHDVPPAPKGGDDASNTTTGEHPNTDTGRVSSTVTARPRARVVNGTVHPVG